MSTRNTVAYDEKFHVYSEIFDNGGIYVELEGHDNDFEVYPGRITVRIPKKVMEAILEKSEEIRDRLNVEDWDETQEPQEWKKSE